MPPFSISTDRIKRMSIPKIIWQTYKTKIEDVPSYAVECIQSWKDHNPEYRYNYMSDEDAREFIQAFYGDNWVRIFDSVPLGVMRGDMIRYLVIYQFGGVYADLDTLCMKPISSWMVDDADIILAPEGNLEFCVWTFAASPKNPIIKNVIDRMEKAFENPDYTKPHFVHRLTGPWSFTRAIFDKLGCATLDIIKDFNRLNKSEGGLENNIYCYGGYNAKIFEDECVKHLFGSQNWKDGQYDQWVEDPLTKEHISTIDLRKMYVEEEVDYMDILIGDNK